jgi:hypothetical protein
MSRKFFIKVTYSFEYSSFGLLETAERLLLHPDKKKWQKMNLRSRTNILACIVDQKQVMFNINYIFKFYLII